MDPLTISLMGMGINAIADLINSSIRSGRMMDARRIIENLPIPEIDKLSYEAIMMTEPEKLGEAILQDTRLAEIAEDPRLKSAQMDSLAQLEERGKQGYTIQEKADIQRAMNQSLGVQRGANLAADAQMAQRGISGSGIDIAGRLSRQQGGVNAASQAGLDIASQAQQRALQAMQAAGQLGGQVRGQEWAQKSQVAEKQDAIAKANALNKMTTDQFNIQAKMQQEAANQAAQNEALARKAEAEADIIQAKRDRDLAMANTYLQ